MNEKEEVYECILCGRKITFDGLCQECYEIEIADLDYEDEDY
ncbi:MAG: hypothetical protein QXZ02_04245 [Candidatus Bathyarchaeia archaeon]